MQIFKPVVEVTQPEVLAGLKAALAKEAAELKAEHGHDHAGHADGKHGRSELVESTAKLSAVTTLYTEAMQREAALKVEFDSLRPGAAA